MFHAIAQHLRCSVGKATKGAIGITIDLLRFTAYTKKKGTFFGFLLRKTIAWRLQLQKLLIDHWQTTDTLTCNEQMVRYSDHETQPALLKQMMCYYEHILSISDVHPKD